MATTTLTNNWRRDSFNKVIDSANDTFRMPLYNASSHDANTGAYTTVAEVANSGTYAAGGAAMTGAAQTTDTTNNVSFYDWADVSYTSSTITATDCMIYDDTVTTPTANVSVYIGDFGGSRTTSNGTFTITLPGATFSTAIVRIA